jgi:hypothetical protein
MLNEELSWKEVCAISTGSGRVCDAFQLAFGDPTKELLPAGSLEKPRFPGQKVLNMG